MGMVREPIERRASQEIVVEDLWGFMMMKTFEDIVTNRINRYNRSIYELSPLGCG